MIRRVDIIEIGKAFKAKGIIGKTISSKNKGMGMVESDGN